MHNWKLYLGIILILISLLPSIGINPGFVPVLSGPLLVIVAIVGGYLIAKRGRS